MATRAHQDYTPGSNRKPESNDPVVNERREKQRREYVVRRYGYDPESQVRQEVPVREEEPTVAEQWAHLLGDEDLAKDTFKTKDVARMFDVTPGCVLRWRKNRWIDAIDQEEGARGAYHYSINTIRSIQRQASEILPYTKRYWLRILVARREGRPIR